MNRAYLALFFAALAAFSGASLCAQIVSNEGFAGVDYENAASSNFLNDPYVFHDSGGPHIAERSLTFEGGSVRARATSAIQTGRLSFHLTGSSEITRPIGDVTAHATAFAVLSYADRIGFYSPSQPYGAPLSVRLSAVVTGTNAGAIEPRPNPGDDPRGEVPDPSPDGVGFYNVSTYFAWGIAAPSPANPTTYQAQYDEINRLFELHDFLSSPGGLDLEITVPNDPAALYRLDLRAFSYAFVGVERLNGTTTPTFARFNVDYDAGMAWNGVTSAFAGNQALNDLSVFSDSGIDYKRSYVMTPVPEISTYGLFSAAGLLALVLFRRQRRSQGTIQKAAA